eukprot:5084043-Pyramimonas_sp.AAC.1
MARQDQHGTARPARHSKTSTAQHEEHGTARPARHGKTSTARRDQHGTDASPSGGLSHCPVRECLNVLRLCPWDPCVSPGLLS